MVAAAVLEDMAAHRTTVRGVLLRLVKDEALADDLVQEALLRATRAAGGLRGDCVASDMAYRHRAQSGAGSFPRHQAETAVRGPRSG
ncbi:MAG: hypothetical protein FJX37_01040 [Alphaproteobacteria bacterium]|nr:hypothetical protein [Alphaproteobacteria bacterium]MBM3733654.1 hypothetical protein [Acidimicrobiia bacterium]